MRVGFKGKKGEGKRGNSIKEKTEHTQPPPNKRLKPLIILSPKLFSAS